MFAFDGFIRRELDKLIGTAGDAKVSVKGGNVVIEDCHFDEAAFEDIIFPPTDPMLPPLRLGTMHVRKLAITIPWGNFSKGFIDVELDGLSINCYRRPLEEATSEMLRARREACVAGLMEQLISTLTAMTKDPKSKKKPKTKQDAKASKPATDEPDTGGGGPFGRFVRGIVRQVLQSFRPIVRLTNVHIRYEDLLPDTSSPMALGLTIQRLFIQHPDSPYSEMIEDPEMQPVKDVTSLELNLDGVGLYMHTASMGVQSVIGGGPAAQAAAEAAGSASNAKKLSAGEARRLAASGGGADDRTVGAMGALFGELMRGGDDGPHGPQQWLLRPIRMSGKVHVNVGVFIKAPTRWDWNHLAVANLTVSPIRLAVSEAQATSLVAAGAALAVMPARYLFVMLRPAVWNPRAVLRAAMNAVRMALITVSPSTRLRNAIRDRSKYQKVLVHALLELRKRDGSATPQLEDIKHVTSTDKLPLASVPMTLVDSARPQDALLEMDALSTPMQIAMWRIVAWSQAKEAAEQEKLQGKKGGRAASLLSGLSSAKKSVVNSDELMAASDAVTQIGDPGEEQGEDPLAGAPRHFNLVCANLRVLEISLKLVIDDSANHGSLTLEAGAKTGASSALAAKTVTTTTTTVNLDGSVTTTTSVTTFEPPVRDAPISTALGVRIGPIVARAWVAPKEGIRAHAAIGELVIEHSTARGGHRMQPLVCFPGETDIPDTSPLLGPPMPETEEPRPALFGFFGGGRKKTPPPPSPASEGGGPAGAPVASPPAVHAVVTLPPEQPPGEMPPDGSLKASIVIDRGDLRLAPHQLHELFLAYFTPLDRALDLMPGPALARDKLAELRLFTEGMLTKPWWAILSALPATAEGLSGAMPALMPLDITATIRHGLSLHILAEPPVDAEPLAPLVPLAMVRVPPLRIQLAPASSTEVKSEYKEVRIGLTLDGDVVLGAPKAPKPFRPFSGPEARPSVETSRMMPMLISEQMQLVERLAEVRTANRSLAADLQSRLAVSRSESAALLLASPPPPRPAMAVAPPPPPVPSAARDDDAADDEEAVGGGGGRAVRNGVGGGGGGVRRHSEGAVSAIASTPAAPSRQISMPALMIGSPAGSFSNHTPRKGGALGSARGRLSEMLGLKAKAKGSETPRGEVMQQM